nr:MAG TPA: hypothetical protein [Caudoviricetes sp.]
MFILLDTNTISQVLYIFLPFFAYVKNNKKLYFFLCSFFQKCIFKQCIYLSFVFY